jgi:hypothetical protein
LAKKIIYLNQQSLLADTESRNLLDSFSYPWHCLEFCNTNFDPGTQSLYVRAGENNLPFSNDIVDILGWRMPKFQPDFSLDFGAATDLRCLELRQQKWNLPWIVFWSGGIDSTTIVCSILKNIPKSDWGNISIACNHGSIAEYPWFFNKFIRPNFRVLDSSHWIHNVDDQHFFINGEPADQLFAGSIAQMMMLDDKESMSKSIFKEPDDLIKYLGRNNQEFGRWYYETVTENLGSVDVPVNSYHDFFWWTFFNYSWVSIKLRTLLWGGWSRSDNARDYFDHMITWFDTQEYQLWSMASNMHGAKYGNTVGNYKQAAKDYIYRGTKDPYYHRFKTKTSSGSNLAVYFLERNPWVAMLDDLTLLNFADHRDQLLELLPDHLTFTHLKKACQKGKYT